MTHLVGKKKVYTGPTGVYAAEVYKVVLVGGVIIPDKVPLDLEQDTQGYARVNLHPGDMFMVRVYNYDKEHDASARVVIDTLDTFAFSTVREPGKSRWGIPKSDAINVDGWDYKDGKALAFMVGA